jgi:CRP-like cAMP-binding protein
MLLTPDVASHYGFTEADMSLTMESFVSESFHTNDFFLKEGNVSDKIAFVKQGLLHSFIYNDQAQEVTTQFYPSGSLVISSESFNNRIPARENIVALVGSELVVITYEKLHKLYDAIPGWQMMCKDLADKKSDELITRSLQFQTMSATERYQHFVLNIPKSLKVRHLNT